MSNPAQPKKVAISYAWKQEKEGENKGAVDRLCERLAQRGVPILRDTNDLKPGEEIRKFMRSIGASDFLCVFLSDDYLRSRNCMYELLIAWQRSRDDGEGFRGRVKVWPMPGMSGIHKLEARVPWVEYWRSEAEKTKEAVQSMGGAVAGRSVDEMRRCKEIADSIDDILGFIGDTLSPQSFEDFEKWIEEEFPWLKEPTEAELAAVFLETAGEIEAVLGANDLVSKFMKEKAKELLDPGSDGRRLCDSVKAGKFDVSASLGRVKGALSNAEFKSRGDLDDLEKVIGGLVVMAIDPRWVYRQRVNGGTAAISYPGGHGGILLDGGVTADFLYMVTQALAGGYARLHRIFGTTGRVEQDRRIAPPPVVNGGVALVDRATLMKLHLIKSIQGSDATLNEGDPAAVDARFKVVRKLVEYAFRQDRNPYFSDSPAFRDFSELVKGNVDSGNLEVSDLLLLMPSGKGSEEELLGDYVFVLKHLHHIFQAIEARRKQLS
jgi:hypothetical protein